MTVNPRNPADRALVAAQLGREPREPWRVAVRCPWGWPSVIVSPSVLVDGTPFPTLAWLTCPWLIEMVSAMESAGAVAQWAARLTNDPDMARRLQEADTAFRAARQAESRGQDPCATVGIAGQRDATVVKCLHAHVALALMQIDDPVGLGVLDEIGMQCNDNRCTSLIGATEQKG